MERPSRPLTFPEGRLGRPLYRTVLDPARHPAINNAGTVAVYRSLPGFVGNYSLGNGGALSTILSTSGGPLDGFSLYTPSLNDAGQIAFYADKAAPDGLRVYRGDPGGAVALIGASGAGTFNGLIKHVSINNSGNVGYTVAGSGALDGAAETSTTTARSM